MPSALDNASFPSTPQVSDEVKNIINEFYALADVKDPNNGKTMAEEIFTQNAVIHMPHITFSGKEEITQCRSKAWDTVKFRKHTIHRVYAADMQGKDILACGTVESHPTEGQPTIQEFASRAVFEEAKGRMMIKSYQGWAGMIGSA